MQLHNKIACKTHIKWVCQKVVGAIDRFICVLSRIKTICVKVATSDYIENVFAYIQ